MVNSRHVEKAVEILAKLTNKPNMLAIIVGIRTMLDRALVVALSTMFRGNNSPTDVSSTRPVDLREVTKAVEAGIEQTDLKELLEGQGAYHFLGL
jgi:hypothetical protein